MAQPNSIKTARGTVLELYLPGACLATFPNPSTHAYHGAITCTPIDFSTTIPVYEPYFAVVLDNVFSAAECDVIRSVPKDHWTFLNQGDAFREVDRTLVLNRQIADTLYARILPHLEGLNVTRLRKATTNSTQSRSSGTDNDNEVDKPQHTPHDKESSQCRDWSDSVAGPNNLKANQGVRKATWEMYGANERLSFLRYGPGMHHDRHCDQVFSRPDSAKEDKSFLTAQVYLSDAWHDNPSAEGKRDEGSGAGAGGTTRFWGPPGSEFAECFVDVVPRAGRVLAFQQRMLWHSGEPVMEGVKYAMRTDLMYKRSFT